MKVKFPSLPVGASINSIGSSSAVTAFLTRPLKKYAFFNRAAQLRKVILYFPDIQQMIGLGVDADSTQGVASSAMTADLKLGRVTVLGSVEADGINRMRASGPFFSVFFGPLK